MSKLSHPKIETLVRKHYNLMPIDRTSKMMNGSRKQDKGYRNLILCEDGYDEKAERVRKVEALKQSARVTTHDRFTPDSRIGD